MKNYIFSICISIIVVTIFSLILPKGRINSILKYIYSFFVVIIIISPIINIKNFDIDQLFFNEKFEILEDFLYFQGDLIGSEYKKKCENILQNYGLDFDSVDVVYDNKEILYVEIKLTNPVIFSDKSNINSIDEIVKEISANLSINESNIIFYGI